MAKRKRKKVRSFATDIDGPCPFCDGTFAAGVEAGAVVHSLPPCKTFNDLDAYHFIHAVRLKTVGPLPDDPSA